ncbi:MAG: ornithine cyclodeaminase family protein [Firmicutes bacterium]|nr:ornithine cyclodeaminase family protein [Bacillota bacterium]
MLLLSRDDIDKVFSMKEAVEAVKDAFVMVSEKKCEAPLRTMIQAPKRNGAFLFMPAYSRELDAASLKCINQFPGNIDKGLPSSPAQVLLIDGITGLMKAVLDGTRVTQIRTGAASGAAFDVLAKKDCRKGALIGTGGQAASQLEAMLCARKLEKVMVYDLNKERTEAFARRMNAELARYGAKITAAASSDECVEDADLLITVTPSSKPAFDGTKIKKGATVSCVGAYQYHMQELDPGLLPRASKIFCDSVEAVLSESGDLLKPLDQGIITRDDITGDLGCVINGRLKGRENDDEIIIFETVGVAAQDLVTACRIYEKAASAGIGLSWE